MQETAFDKIDPNDALRHYGYKPEDIHRNGVGHGIWRREEAFQNLNSLREFMKAVDETKKVRIEFNYDPDYPAAVFVTYVALKV